MCSKWNSSSRFQLLLTKMSKSQALFYHGIFVSKCSLFLYFIFIQKLCWFFFVCLLLVSHIIYQETSLLIHSNSIHVTILVLEQPYFMFWLLSCCNASSCIYQFESSTPHLCMKIAELIEKGKTSEHSRTWVERKGRMSSGSVPLNLPQPVMFSNLKAA